MLSILTFHLEYPKCDTFCNNIFFCSVHSLFAKIFLFSETPNIIFQNVTDLIPLGQAQGSRSDPWAPARARGEPQAGARAKWGEPFPLTVFMQISLSGQYILNTKWSSY